MVRFHFLILILQFSEFRIDLVLADQSTEKISALIQSYADAFTTIAPKETQSYPKIEAQEYVNHFTKAKYDNQPAFANVPSDIVAPNPKYTSYEDSSSTSEEESNESKEPAGPADHVIPFSEHENPKEPSTRPNYTAPGDWAKPPPEKNIPLDFVPTKFLAQVRDSHTVKHVPRDYAADSAETSEEKENAARLKEVVKESKANTIYTEEGYEDAAYDHAGHIRDADFQEDFERKLNEELERKNYHSGKKKRPKTYKNRKPRKLKDKNHGEFIENIKDHSERIEKMQAFKPNISPEDLRVLKSALNHPVIDPALFVESGISNLEKDLKNEYREAQRTSTEQYVTTMLPVTFKPPATESPLQTKIDLKTTTTRRNVFTVRPKKTLVTVLRKPHQNKLKKPLKAFSVPSHIDSYNAYSTSSYSYEPTQVPTTVDYGNVVWGYLLQNPNATQTITYPTPQQSVNPLAVATVNGHGPYLVVVTTPPDSFISSPSESQNLVSNMGYGAVNEYNVTQPIVIDSNSFTTVNRKVNHVNYNKDPQIVNMEISKPAHYQQGETRHHEKNSKSKKLKSQHLSEDDPNYIKEDRDSYMEYYTTTQAKRQSYAQFDKLPEIFNSRKVLENEGSDGIERPPIQLKKEKGTPPVTKLLPPAPLSTSEYATFHRQNIGSKSVPPSVMQMMPIIDAIHKHEYEQNSFPFLLRRKRSTFGFFRAPNFNPRERGHREIDSHENSSQNSSYPRKINSTMHPSNFHSLLNESPQVAIKEVDTEIKKRFKNDTRSLSDESSSQSHKKLTSKENSKLFSGRKENEVVEVEVPELNFANVFEKDEIERTTQSSRVNTKKYPFYKDSSVLRNTALNYIVNPKEVPKKTLGGMEFYDSRVRECEEVNPNLEKIVPEDEQIINKRGPQEKKLRLHHLGDKIDCYKAKYFDETPFDNPLFLEKKVEMPSPPTELNPKVFASRILELPTEKEDYTILQGPKNPEFFNVKRAGYLQRPSRHHVFEVNVRHHLHPRKSNLVNTSRQRYRYPFKNPISNENQMKSSETRPKKKIKASKLKVVPRYQHLVYEDVMGNIMNLDKSKKFRVPKRGITTKHYKRDNNREQEISGSKKLKRVTITGLVPPPQKVLDKLVKSRHRNNFSDVLTKNLRIYKRSITLHDNEHLSSKETTDNVIKNDKSTFRIVFTTPQSRNKPSEKQVLNSDKTNVTVAQNISHMVNVSPKYLNRSDADPGHYGKFFTNESVNSSIKTRRKEPKYKIVKKNSSHNGTSKFYRDTAPVSSTFVPAMVRLYDNFTARIPRGSKNHQAKQQLAGNTDNNTSTDKPKVLNEKHEQTVEQEEDPKKQFIVFKPVKHKNKNETNDAAVTTVASPPDIQDHSELVEFLKGNPPGYDEAFTKETVPSEDKKKELYKVIDENSDVKELPKDAEIHNETLETHELPKDEEIEDENFESETEDPGLEEQNKEAYGQERVSDDESEQVEENKESEDSDEEKSSNTEEQEDKPFVRFSSRPESPPENYEDEKYADLGPRVNKPYFYHPPFDIPTYEKYGLDKVDHSGDEYGHEDSEYPERYVFPWEDDNEDGENKEQSAHYTALDRHEFPWERRERRERERQKRERQKREKLHMKYDKKGFLNSKYDTDSHGKASGIKLVYNPPKNKYLRGKKDVNNLQSTLENYSSKFSSQYNSAKIKNEEADNKTNDDIENIEPVTPKDESINTSLRTMDSNRQESLTALDSSKLERSGRIISTTASSTNRTRGKTRRRNVSNSKPNRNETVQADETSLRKIQPILSSKVSHQRGRNRHSATIVSTTTAAKPSIRRRTRLTSTSTTIRTTPKSVDEKRRRPFRVNNARSTTPLTVPTSTGRTVEREHRSRVSKEMIITKTVEDSDDEDHDEDSNKNTSTEGSRKSSPKVAEISRSRIRHRQQTKSLPGGENPSKKERVEKVTITMEETPDHVYETKEIDKDGIKGKFITITANNNSDKAVPTKRSRGHTSDVDDAELEEMQRRMEAFKSFDSVIHDTENLGNEPSSLRTAENYVIGSLLQKLPLPLTRKLIDNSENSTTENNNYGNEDEDEDQSEEDDGDADDDDEEIDEETDSEELTGKKIDEETNRDVTTDRIEKNPSVIKDPNNRNYYYVEAP